MALEIYMTLLSVLLFKEVPEVLGEKSTINLKSKGSISVSATTSAKHRLCGLSEAAVLDTDCNRSS